MITMMLSPSPLPSLSEQIILGAGRLELICALLSRLVALLCPSLVAQKLRVHARGVAVTLALGLFDAVPVRLVCLITRGVELLLDHGEVLRAMMKGMMLVVVFF